MSVSAQLHEVGGHLSALQEHRFRLVTDAGHTYLFTVSHDAAVDEFDLRRFVETGAHVKVRYAGEPGLTSGVAHAVRTA
jgi:hypothetical protein